MADNVQLKREELVGNDVVLENINPKTNTGSIINDPDGTNLNETINRIWNAINDKLSRIVNSVNGRTGAVVVNSSDVGLGRVDNVSFADIQEWVLNRLRIEFENKKLHLYDNMDEVETIVASNDAAYVNTPFYTKRGWLSSPITAIPSYLAYIGYFYWDTATDHLKCSYKPINVIGTTDNSILYNESNIDNMYGMLRVNIWNDPTNALEIKNPELDKSHSGLWVNPAKVNSALYFYKGCYGVNGDVDHPETDAFLDITNTAAVSREVEFTIDGVTLSTPYYLNETSFKIGDIIICQFSDDNYRHYDSLEGSYKLNTGVNSTFVDTSPKIGQVKNVYDADDLTNHPKFEITFLSMKPYVDFGLGYYVPDELNQLDNAVLGVKTVTGRINDDSIDSNTNMSGINIIGSIANNKKEYIENEFNTVTPAGPSKTVYRNTDIDVTVDGISTGVAIVPDMSLNVIPSENFGKGNEGLLPNWPLKTAGNVDDRTNIQSAEKDITYLGINLDKILRYKTSETIDGDTFIVVSGFYSNGEFYSDEDLDPETHKIIPITDGRYIDKFTGDVYIYDGSSYILTDREVSEFIDPTSNALNSSGLTILHPSDKTGNGVYTAHSGGLAVNVGDFLEIGDLGPTANYYNNGKVNVRIDESRGLCNTQDENLNYTNKIGVKIDTTSGLAFNSNGTLKNNTGIGMKISKYNSGAAEGENNDRFIAPSINDIEPLLVEDIEGISTDDIDYFGGLRYIFDNNYSTIGVRINDWDYVYNGEPIRHGTEGLRITDNNVLGIQPCNDSVVIIKHLQEYIEENFSWATILPMPTMIFQARDTTPGGDPRNAIVSAYSVFTSENREKLKVAERCYAVIKNDEVTRYVYVGNPIPSEQPTVDDYEPMFEFFANRQAFDRKYIPDYVQLDSQPSDWTSNWKRYYRKNGDVYTQISDAVMPAFSTGTFWRYAPKDSSGKEPNRDKIYVLGLYGEVHLKTWGPKRKLFLPEVTNSPIYISFTSTGDDIDKVSATDASFTLRAYADINANKPSGLCDEALLRSNFNSGNQQLTPVDASKILVYCTHLSTPNPKYMPITKLAPYWNEDYTPSEPWTYNAYDGEYTYEGQTVEGHGTHATGMCYGEYFPNDNTSQTPVPIYYVRETGTNNYRPLKEAFSELFNSKQTVPFNYDNTLGVYDGKIYTVLSSATTITELRAWNHTNYPDDDDPAYTDELIDIPGSATIDKPTPIINNYESGVDIILSETHGITKVAPSYGNTGGISVKITDTSSGDDSIVTNELVNGGLRYASDGGVAIRVNENSDYNAKTGTGVDNLSDGSLGMKITDKNVLGIKFKPKSINGFTFDADGNITMTGFVAMIHPPADWAVGENYKNYYVFDPFWPAYLSDAERAYREYHVTTRDFKHISGDRPDFEPYKYYVRFAEIGYDGDV